MKQGILGAVSFCFCVGWLRAAPEQGRLAPENLEYVGAFRLERKWAPDYETWDYSNGPIAYYPDGDPHGPDDGYPGSLFMAGHVYRSRVAELDIPAPLKSKRVADLAMAKFRQPLTDVMSTVPIKNGFIMGMAYIPSEKRIYFTHGSDYSDGDCDPANSPPGLGSFAPDLSAPATQGLWFLSSRGARLHPFTSLRYIMEVPRQNTTAHISATIATGRHRGWCPEGTNLYASSPTQGRPAAPGSAIPATTLMQFGSFDQKRDWSKEHSPANAYQGGAWLTRGTKSAVVISGIIDYDPAHSYYGYDNWKLPAACDPDPIAKGCSGGRGWRAADPRAALLFYDPNDLTEVANSKRQPWQVEWYAKLDVTSNMFRRYTSTMLTTGADAEDLLMTFDSQRGIVYLTESFADELQPVVHVFRIAG